MIFPSSGAKLRKKNDRRRGREEEEETATEGRARLGGALVEGVEGMTGKRVSEVPLMAGLGPSYAPRAPKTSRLSKEEETKVDALQFLMNAARSKAASNKTANEDIQRKEE